MIAPPREATMYLALIAVLAAAPPARPAAPAAKPTPLPRWQADYDPPPPAAVWPDGRPKDVALDGRPTGGEWSAAAGRFLVTAEVQPGGELFRIYDLATGAKVGELVLDRPIGLVALNADGTRLAAFRPRFAPVPRPKAAGGAAGPAVTPAVVRVYNVPDKKLVGEFEVPEPPAALAFLDGGRVLCLGLGGAYRRAYAIDTGKLVWDDRPPAKPDPVWRWGGGPADVSPGGRFVAVAHGAAVRVFRSDTGTTAGVLRLVIPQVARDHEFGRCQDLRFSPDGTLLAALYHFNVTYRLYCWDLRTGRETAYFPPPPGQTVFANTTRLGWSGDGKSLLLGPAVLDPLTGKTLWRLPDDRTGRRLHPMASSHHLVELDFAARAVRMIPLPGDRIEAARAAVRNGGTAADPFLPPEAAVAVSTAPAAEAGAWRATPDPAPPAATPAGPIDLPFRGDSVASLHVAPRAAVAELGRWIGYPSMFDSIEPRTLVRADLATGRETGRLALPPRVRLAGIDPDAARAVTLDAEEGRRVDVWSLDAGRHVAGWRPEPDARDETGRVLLAAVLAGGRVLTVSATGTVALWEPPAAKPVYAVAAPGLEQPALSPGGKYLFGVQGSAVRVFETATGAAAGAVPIERPSPQWRADPPRLAVRPDGREVMVESREWGPTQPTRLVRFDTGTGKLVADVRVPPSGGNIDRRFGYVGPNHVFSDGSVIDLRLGRTVLSFDPRAMRTAVARPDARLWSVVWTPPTRKDPAPAKSQLVAADLAGLLDALAARLDGPDGVLKPGGEVAVAVECEGPAAAAARAAVTAWLAARQMKTDDRAAAVIRVRAKEQEQAGAKPVDVTATVAGTDPPETVRGQIRPVRIQTEWTVEVDGREVWGWRPTFAFGSILPEPLTVPDRNADLNAAYRAAIWRRGLKTYAHLPIPDTMVRVGDRCATLPLRAELTADGPKLTPLPEYSRR